jgi:CheY-like chemotaxis protein/phosphoribosyl 1,2-cyclic phosphodiesterase
MRVRFWGTRGSIATPGPSTNRFGGNTTCVELTSNQGQLLIFDIGTGARQLGIDLIGRGLPTIRGSILLTHTHWDHIQGFPFFAPLFGAGNEFHVYAPEGGGGSLHQLLAGQMEFRYFPVEIQQLPATIAYHDLAEGPHEIEGLPVTAQFLHHPAMTLGYRVEADDVAVVVLTDHEPFADTLWRSDAEPGHIESILHEGDRRHARFMANADLVIHDAQYTPEEYPAKKTWGHSTYEYVVECAAAAGVRRLALTHHDPTHDDAFVAGIEHRARELAVRLGSPMEVFCAYEGREVQVQPARVPVSQVDTQPVAPVGSVASARIVVTDDDQDVRALTKRALERDGHQVVEATSGAEALRLVREEQPDLLVLDLVMPDMGGLEVLDTLRGRPDSAALPVLILTSMDDEGSTREGFDRGATDYLTKPFSMPQLAARVRSILARAMEQHVH